jgi:hypothetical protein
MARAMVALAFAFLILSVVEFLPRAICPFAGHPPGSATTLLVLRITFRVAPLVEGVMDRSLVLVGPFLGHPPLPRDRRRSRC